MKGVRSISGWGRGGLWGWAGGSNLPASAAYRSGAERLKPYCVLNRPENPVKNRGDSFSDATSVSSAVTGTSESLQEGRDVAKAISTLRRAQAVCFDVDSTILQEEGIDILARCVCWFVCFEQYMYMWENCGRVLHTRMDDFGQVIYFYIIFIPLLGAGRT